MNEHLQLSKQKSFSKIGETSVFLSGIFKTNVTWSPARTSDALRSNVTTTLIVSDALGLSEDGWHFWENILKYQRQQETCLMNYRKTRNLKICGKFWDCLYSMFLCISRNMAWNTLACLKTSEAQFNGNEESSAGSEQNRRFKWIGCMIFLARASSIISME